MIIRSRISSSRGSKRGYRIVRAQRVEFHLKVFSKYGREDRLKARNQGSGRGSLLNGCNPLVRARAFLQASQVRMRTCRRKPVEEEE